MSRRPPRFRSAPLLLALLLSASLAPAYEPSATERPVITLAKPDPARQKQLASWLTEFGAQRPALELALGELDRQRRRWPHDRDIERCRRAKRALAKVDRGVLLAVADYTLLSAVGEGLDDLDGAVRACAERRYFEFDYRLERGRRSLARARDRALRQARR